MLLLLLACGGGEPAETDTPGTTETDTPGTTETDTPGTTDTGWTTTGTVTPVEGCPLDTPEVLITRAEGGCNAYPDMWDFRIDNAGCAAYASLDLFRLGDAPADEHHSGYTHLQAADGYYQGWFVGPLAEGEPWVDGVSSAFTCAEAGQITFAFRLYDAHHRQLSCALLGPDADAVRAGEATYTHAGDPAAFAGCFDL
jgi:hypothetical protein